ncbi:MAG: hypothetical protein HYR55_04585 [Acidobacteria bacterium]|nr:hypothetical protein [Acidobacteriota bacterium]MBI3657566.1 hypothetical protein [Acidobacteriota bacterium]
MPFVLFHDHFPEIAERETRTIMLASGSQFNLPAGQYSFLEMFCDELGCDCRRVFLYVVSSRRKNVEAVVNYGWESPSFYAKWMKHDDPDIIANLKGPCLNFGSPQSRLAPAILELACNLLLQDEAYIERIKRHYQIFRDKVDGHRRTKKGKKA